MTMTAGTAQRIITGMILSSVSHNGITDRIATCSRLENGWPQPASRLAYGEFRGALQQRSRSSPLIGSCLISYAGAIRIARSRQQAAAGLQNFPGSIEGEVDSNRIALAVQVVERDTVGRRHYFLQPERLRRAGVEPGLPIGLQRNTAAMNRALIALAGEAGIQSVQIEQRVEIALAASIEPVDGDGDLIKVFRQVRHSRFAPGSGRVRQRSTAIAVNAY
jgi:hypothetical protein